MSKKALTSLLATSMGIMLVNEVRNKAYENMDLLSDKGSAMYLPKRSYKNKLRKNKGKR